MSPSRRLEVDVGGAALDRVGDHGVDELDHRRVAGRLEQVHLLDVVVDGSSSSISATTRSGPRAGRSGPRSPRGEATATRTAYPVIIAMSSSPTRFAGLAVATSTRPLVDERDRDRRGSGVPRGRRPGWRRPCRSRRRSGRRRGGRCARRAPVRAARCRALRSRPGSRRWGVPSAGRGPPPLSTASREAKPSSTMTSPSRRPASERVVGGVMPRGASLRGTAVGAAVIVQLSARLAVCLSRRGQASTQIAGLTVPLPTIEGGARRSGPRFE